MEIGGYLVLLRGKVVFEDFLEELGLAEALISVLDESSQGN